MSGQSGPTTPPGMVASRGSLLRGYRLRAGLTQEQLGERSGYSANYIGKLERDQRPLSPAPLARLAMILDLAEHERASLQSAPVAVRPDAQIPPLAGRERELEELRRHLHGAGSPVLLLAGEPGIGKTRLLQEASALAARGGWLVLRGGCQRRATDPYSPLSTALREALRFLPDTDRDAAAGSGLGLLLPELTEEELPESGSAPRRRHLLFSAAARAMKAAAGATPGVVLVLDDLQWAGSDALDLLAALLASTDSPVIRVIGAYRDTETPAGANLADLVADLAGASQVRVLELEPLSDAEAEQLVLQRATDIDGMRGLLPSLVRRAGGVPFFLTSFIDEVRSAGTDAGELTVPWTVGQVIGQRVQALPEQTQKLLAVVAIAGREVSPAQLMQFTNLSEDEVVGALEDAAAARLLAETPTGEYRLTHDLIREAIADGLSLGRRRLLHRRIAETMQRDSRASAELLAFHFVRSEDTDRAIVYLELAGDQAQARVAYAAAADFFRQAISRLQALGRQEEATAVGEKLGVCLYRAGRYDEAIPVLQTALEARREAGDEESVQRLTGRLADAHYRRGTGTEDLEAIVGRIERGELRPDGVTSDGAVTRWEGLARLLFARGAYPRMVSVGRTLARAGRATGRPGLRKVGARIEGTALIHLGRMREGAELLAATIPADPLAERDAAAAEVGTLVSAVYLAMGALEPSWMLSTRMIRGAEAAGDQIVASIHAVLLAAICSVRGEGMQGRGLLVGAQRSLSALGPSTPSLRISPLLARVLVWEGKWAQARSSLEDTIDAARSMRIALVEHTALVYLAQLDLLEGHPEQARDRLQALDAQQLPWTCAVAQLTTIAEAHADLGDTARAKPYAERSVAEARRTGCWVDGVRALEVVGRIQTRLGNLDVADAALREGLDRARLIRFPRAEASILRAARAIDGVRDDARAAKANSHRHKRSFSTAAKVTAPEREQ